MKLWIVSWKDQWENFQIVAIGGYLWLYVCPIRKWSEWSTRPPYWFEQHTNTGNNWNKLLKARENLLVPGLLVSFVPRSSNSLAEHNSKKPHSISQNINQENNQSNYKLNIPNITLKSRTFGILLQQPIALLEGNSAHFSNVYSTILKEKRGSEIFDLPG